jgi:hypothetical protein
MGSPMTSSRAGVAAVFGAAFLFAAVTLAALEGREVVVLGTFDERGARRQTRTWVADEDGSAWVEAANPERPFLLDIVRNPEIEMRRAGAARTCHAVPVANPEGHNRIRRLLAARYGWADAWIGFLADTSDSIAIRLDCR